MSIIKNQGHKVRRQRHVNGTNRVVISDQQAE